MDRDPAALGTAPDDGIGGSARTARRRNAAKALPSRSYVVPCSSTFRDAILDLVGERGISVGDLVRSVLYVIDPAIVLSCPDPGEPAAEDREEVVLRSGPSKDRRLRRKPRLQARLNPGYEPVFIRKALALGLAMARGAVALKLTDPEAPDHQVVLSETRDELERLRAVVSVLAFDPLKDGVRTRAEALYVLGFPPNARPDTRVLKEKFRLLARIHHPDSGFGDHTRMAQLNQALAILQRGHRV